MKRAPSRHMWSSMSNMSSNCHEDSSYVPPLPDMALPNAFHKDIPEDQEVHDRPFFDPSTTKASWFLPDGTALHLESNKSQPVQSSSSSRSSSPCRQKRPRHIASDTQPLYGRLAAGPIPEGAHASSPGRTSPSRVYTARALSMGSSGERHAAHEAVALGSGGGALGKLPHVASHTCSSPVNGEQQPASLEDDVRPTCPLAST
jgi:hypothetical protein